ncbi:ion channel [Shewanella baltica]|uniref:ion channel n=1 Tax=Shewanella baltica TaxID=62322 RepID=UPI003D01FB63
MKKSITWLVKYLGCVLAFSIIYYAIWKIKPDSFIINPQMNVQPFQSIQHFLWDDKPSYSISSEVDLSLIKKNYDEYYLNISQVESRILENEASLKKLEMQFNIVKKQRDIDVDKNFDLFDKLQLEEFKTAEEKLDQELRNLEASLPDRVATEDDLAVLRAVGEKRIELAKAKSNTATQAVKNSEFLVENITGFFSQEVRDAFTEIFDTRSSLYQERYAYEKQRGDLRVKAIDVVSNDLLIIRERVKFVDFIFFSIGISTTTTFGDLVANSIITKLFVSLQLLLCIVIVAGFLESISKKKSYDL